MQHKLLRNIAYALLLLVLGSIAPTYAYDLTQEVQKSLISLGYDPGNADGEATVQTIVALAQFEAEHGLEVNAEITPQIAGILAAEVAKIGQPEPTPADDDSVAESLESGDTTTEAGTELAAATAAIASSDVNEGAAGVPVAAESSAATQPGADLQAEAVAETPVEETVDPEVLKAAQRKCIEEKVAEARAADKKSAGFNSLMSAVGRTAGQLGSDDVADTAGGLADANATAADLSSAARDLGLTEDEIAECENPL